MESTATGFPENICGSGKLGCFFIFSYDRLKTSNLEISEYAW